MKVIYINVLLIEVRIVSSFWQYCKDKFHEQIGNQWALVKENFNKFIIKLLLFFVKRIKIENVQKKELSPI